MYEQIPGILENLLKLYNPLWCAANWYGVGHIVVLIGGDGKKIYFNKQDGGLEGEYYCLVRQQAI